MCVQGALKENEFKIVSAPTKGTLRHPLYCDNSSLLFGK